jgi:serpin B
MLRARYVVACALCAVTLAGCKESPSEPEGGPPPALTALPRALTDAEQRVLSSANTFSFAWWTQLNTAQQGENVFVSPLSASFALGMTLNGAANQTLEEMRTALQVGTATQHDINEGYRSAIALLTSLDPAVTASIANSIWYRNGFTFHQTFFDTVKTYFGADVKGLDFTDMSGSLSEINAWVNDRTNGKIPTILDRIRDSDVMFLINAIYFKANWREKFDPARTTTETFHAAEGNSQPVQLMHRRGDMRYAETATLQAVDIPYGNSAFVMTVVLPATGEDIESVASTLTAPAWQTLTGSMVTSEVQLALPKLTLSYERTLNDDLKALGMTIPFIGDQADFTRMSPDGNRLFISSVRQKAFVDIHEEGTEAAAATIVEVGVTSAPVVHQMRVDRPYIFVIRERFSGTILFMGKIVRMPTD